MTSIQGQLLKLYFKAHLLISPFPKTLDVKKERTEMDAMAKLFKPLAEIKCTQADIPGIPAEWITPPIVEKGRSILYLHGGYFISGSIESHRHLAGNIAYTAQARALIIEYRLAPEHRFPADVEDAVAAYEWMLEQGSEPGQVFLAGDSAGGGLVLSCLLALKERGLPNPAGGVCLSPAADLTFSGKSWKNNLKKELIVNPYTAEKLQSIYLGDADAHNPLASPVFGDLRGLPPILIQVGSDELLLSDAETFTERARQAGVEVRLEVWPGMQHVWQYAASRLPEGRQAIDKIGEFIRQH
jgi:epsilon-lactone hydrolase